MAGIRVKDVPVQCIERDLKIYFSKPENGGGPIKRIYFPLFNNDAVIIFENSETVTTVLEKEKHEVKGKEILIEELPFLQAFTEVVAKLDPSVAALILATDELKDEIQYDISIKLCYDENQCLTSVCGDWFMLECLWARIELISKGQGRARRRHVQSKSQTQSQDEETRSYPMEIDNQMISMPSSSDKAVRKEKYSSDEDEKKKGLANVNTESKTKATKEAITGVKDKKFGKIERIGEHETRKKEELDIDNQLKSLAIAESENSNSKSDVNMSKGKETTKPVEAESVDTDIVILSNKPDDVRSLDFRYGPLTVSVYTGWINMAETDAIVNAANGSLKHYGGVADAIAKAAGREMERQCDEYTIKNGHVPTTEVMHTCAGGEISEKVKYIMHAVGPMWFDRFAHKCSVELTNTFLNCLHYGNDVLKIHSITMPVISSGVFGCPLELCIRSFLNAVLLFASEKMEVSTHLEEVNLVNNNSDNTAMTVLQLRNLIPRGARVLLDEAQQQVRHEPADYEVTRVTGQRLALDKDTEYSWRERDQVTRDVTDSYKSGRSALGSYGKGNSLLTDVLSRPTPRLVTSNDDITSTAARVDHQRTTSRDTHPYRDRDIDRKLYDLSIRDQDFGIGSSRSPQLPYSSNYGASRYRDDDVKTSLPGFGDKSSDRSSNTRMTAPPKTSYRTEETSNFGRTGTNRGYDPHDSATKGRPPVSTTRGNTRRY